MGWTVYINRFQNKKEFLENFINEHFSGNVQIIDHSAHQNEHYFLYQLNDTKKAYICCYLIKFKKYEVAEKCIGDFEGMYPADRLIKKLNSLPIDIDALNYIREVKKYKEKRKIKNGTVLKFDHPFRFSNGVTCDTFKYVKNSIFIAAGSSAQGFYARIKNWKDFDFDVISASV